jgi:hypothetical protein
MTEMISDIIARNEAKKAKMADIANDGAKKVEAPAVASRLGKLFPDFTVEQMTGLADIIADIVAYKMSVTEVPKKTRKPRTKKASAKTNAQKKKCGGTKGDGTACANWCREGQDFCHIKSHNPANAVSRPGCCRELTRGAKVQEAKKNGLPMPACGKKVVDGTTLCKKCTEMANRPPKAKAPKKAKATKAKAKAKATKEEAKEETSDVDALLAEYGVGDKAEVPESDSDDDLFGDDDYDE